MSDDISIPSPVYHSVRRDGLMDPGTLRLAAIAGGIVAGGLALYLGMSIIGRHGGEVPVIQADDRPIRVKPENPGGMQIAGSGNDIFSGGSDTNGSKLAPAPEVPDPKSLRAQAFAPPTENTAGPMPLATPKPVATPTPFSTNASTAAVKPAAAKAPVAQQAVIQPPPKLAAQAAQPGARPGPAVPAGKGATIQLAALGSEAAARSEWQILQKRMPDILGSHQPAISRTERDGKIFWRLRTTGFADATQAKTFCDKIRAKGGACSVAEF